MMTSSILPGTNELDYDVFHDMQDVLTLSLDNTGPLAAAVDLTQDSSSELANSPDPPSSSACPSSPPPFPPLPDASSTEDETQPTCPICLDTIPTATQTWTRCSHAFHHLCLLEHKKYSTTCPTCRSSLKEKRKPGRPKKTTRHPPRRRRTPQRRRRRYRPYSNRRMPIRRDTNHFRFRSQPPYGARDYYEKKGTRRVRGNDGKFWRVYTWTSERGEQKFRWKRDQ